MTKLFHPTSSSARSVWRLRHDLAEQERWVGDHLALAEARAVGMSEETITEMVLFNLASAATASSVSVSIPFSKPREAENGADWLWAFVGGGGRVTFLLVQAKKLRRGAATGTYSVEQAASEGQIKKWEEVKRRKNPSLKQRDLLRESSRKLGVPAAYAFYNPADAAELLTRECLWQSTFPSLGGVGLAGVEQVHAVVTARTSTKQSAAAMAPITWPLSCALLCDGGASLAIGSRPLNEIVSASLEASGITVSGGGQTTQDPRAWLQDLRSLLVLPGRGEDMASERAAVAQGLGEAGIQGVTVWRQNRRFDDAVPGHSN